MIFECRVYTPDMKLKQTISREEAQERYWKDVLPDPKDVKGMKIQEVHLNNCETCGALFETKIRTARYCGAQKCKNKREYERRYGGKV